MGKSERKVIAIVAMGIDDAIGAAGRLPWFPKVLKSDMRHFRSLTMGHVVVMGRKTFESIEQPLGGRINIVLSRDPDYDPNGAFVANCLVGAFRIAAQFGPTRKIFIIGGAEVYREMAPYVTHLCITRVAKAFPHCDVAFPIDAYRRFSCEEDSYDLEWDDGLKLEVSWWMPESEDACA